MSTRYYPLVHATIFHVTASCIPPVVTVYSAIEIVVTNLG